MVANSVVVVGAGSAGCVLAARLSAEPRRHVVLVEAGPDYPSTAALPADLADGSLPASSHDWGWRTEPDARRGPLDLPRARVVGGCSATNAGFWLRGWPADYEAWATGWTFDALLPLFRSVEADRDFADEWHGSDGPVPVARVPVADLEPYPRAFVDAALACGHAAVADHNRPGAVGVGPAPRNVRDRLRMSTALTHLAPARTRRNLQILPDTPVDRLELVDGRPRGVRTQRGDVVEAHSVVLAAGAYGSPAILLRSGIGPAAQLRALGIPRVVDLPGVGADLVDHPLVAVDLPATPGRRGPALPVLLTLRSTAADPSGPPDLHLFVAGPFDTPSVPSGAVFGIVTGLMSPRSRGSVRLRSADPADPPVIDPGYLRHPDDVTRMVEATLAARRISRTRPLVDLIAGPEIAPGAAVGDDDATGLAESICRRVGPYHHPVGTCAMGAVVDARGAVHGITGVLVADASIMPTIPSANTNASTIVLAERIASTL
ncbi:MAG TPA: FAD-dependent oxidoreductase [Pseudonocardia sp.]|nr:FAD-dependent oxidoreductase [Pseudonocardia sp.]